MVSIADDLKPPTTRSIFSLVSAPPAKFRFTASRDEWRERELSKHKDTLEKLVLDKGYPISADDERAWNSVFRELEGLEKFLLENDVSSSNVKAVRLVSVVSAVNATAETLLTSVDQAKIEEDYVLMLISLELGMRITKLIATFRG